MIRTIAVSTGEQSYADAAEQHALSMAKAFGARVKAVLASDPRDIVRGERMHAGFEDPAGLAHQTMIPFLEQLRQADIAYEECYHGEGVTDGLLSEAMESDLVVVGLPSLGRVQESHTARVTQHETLPLLRRAECSVLAVFEPPTPLRNILVCYEGGVEGKAALRLSGHLAEKAGAKVWVFPVGNRIDRLVMLDSVAESYLGAFDLPGVGILPEAAPTKSESLMVEAGKETNADVIVIGSEPYGLFQRFMGEATAEALALDTTIPVLLAR